MLVLCGKFQAALMYKVFSPFLPRKKGNCDIMTDYGLIIFEPSSRQNCIALKKLSVAPIGATFLETILWLFAAFLSDDNSTTAPF